MLCDVLGVTEANLAVRSVPFGMPSDVVWGYFAGCGLLAFGLTKVIKDELAQARGLEKILPFGRLFLAVPMAVFGTEHLTDTADIASIIPKWMPAHTFWAYLVGIALIAAALSITLKIQARPAATLLHLPQLRWGRGAQAGGGDWRRSRGSSWEFRHCSSASSIFCIRRLRP